MKFTAKIYAKEILEGIEGKKIIIKNKEKNLNFLKKYNVTNNKRLQIIKSLNDNSFKEKIENKDKNIKTDYLYVFGPIHHLYDFYGIENIVKLYIKIGKVNDYIYAESFHEDSDY